MKTQGFTLIELLAVIVILAIIALIATPIVLNIINDSKDSAQLRSAEMYLKGVETSVASATINNKKLQDGTYPITPDGDICLVELTSNTCDKDNTLEVEMNGEKPESGSITIASGKITNIRLEYENDKVIIKDEDGNLVYGEVGSGSGSDSSNIIPEGGVYTTYSGTVYNAGQEFPEMNNGDYYTHGDYKYTITGGQFTEEGCINYFKGMVGATTEEEWQAFLNNQNMTEDDVIQIGYSQGLIGENKGHFEVSVIDKAKTQYGEMLETINGLGVTAIKNSGFDGCTSLTSITIPDNITSIGSYAFDGCTSLTSITIPDSVTSIGGLAFRDCIGLSSIYLHKNLTTIDMSSFDDTTPRLFAGCDLVIYCGFDTLPSEWKNSEWNWGIETDDGYWLDYNLGVTRAEYESIIAE